ncbi:MAG: alanine racemase [Thermodesulfobacteriota bacterium]
MRPTWAEINLDSLVHNFNVVKGLLKQGVGVLSIVKADAYGHGAVEVSKALEEAGTDMLGVASVEEGMELRDYGIEVPILLLGGIRPEEAAVVVEFSLTPCLYSLDAAESLNAESGKAGKRSPYHLKIDTGMTRLGIGPGEAEDFLCGLAGYKNIVMEGALTHLASAFSESPEDTRAQLDRFSRIVSLIRSKGFRPGCLHSANSAAIQRYPESYLDLVRPGIMLYGSDGMSGLDLRPVMRLKTRIIQLRKVQAGTPVSYGGTFVTGRPSVIATLPVGYADGYMRRLSNRAKVSVRGGLAPLVGTVCMDLITADVTDVEGVSVGDEVILFGDDRVSVDDVASWADTISYEILSITGKRVPRRYI